MNDGESPRRPSNCREVLDCGDGAKGRSPLWEKGKSPNTQHPTSQSGDFADSVTALQDTGALKSAHSRFAVRRAPENAEDARIRSEIFQKVESKAAAK